MLLGILTILPARENRSRHSHVSAGKFMREHVQPTTAGPARAEDGPKVMQRLVAKQNSRVKVS